MQLWELTVFLLQIPLSRRGRHASARVAWPTCATTLSSKCQRTWSKLGRRYSLVRRQSTLLQANGKITGLSVTISTQSNKAYTSKASGITTALFSCLLHGKDRKVTNSLTISDRVRKTSSRDPINCPKTAKKISYPDGGVARVPCGDSIRHNHSIDKVAISYRPLGLRHFASLEISRDYSPAQIFRNLKGSFGQHETVGNTINSAGGRWFKRQDVGCHQRQPSFPCQ